MSEINIKTPKQKAKENFVAGIITLIAGVIFIVSGIITATIIQNQSWNIAFGCVIAACGAAMVGISIYLIVKSKKIMNSNKTY